MFEQELQRKIGDFRELGIPRYILRDEKIHMVENMVSTIIGARRAGKSFRTLQIADEFIKHHTIKDIRQVCLVDFDNPILSNMKASDLKLIQSTFFKTSPEINLNTPLLFILDEIHKIKGWEEYVIDLSKNYNWKVVVTGSSSKLLKDDISTSLRGKAISSVIYPLSFNEFLRFNGFNYGSTTKAEAETWRHFEDYLNWGGFPALTSIKEYSKETLLREYFDTMILKDIIQRYNISKPQQCIKLYRYLLSNISKPTTLQSSYNYIKQSGFTTSRDAVRDYVNWGVDSWLLFMVPIHSNSHKEQERNYKKAYCIDWSLANRNSFIWDGSHSRSFENLIFLSLFRNYSRVCYYLTRTKRQEVDFIVEDDRGHPIIAIQVCMDISHPDTLSRELEPLIVTAKYFNTKKNLIITLNQEKKFKQDGVSIKAIPAWKWLLEQEK